MRRLMTAAALTAACALQGCATESRQAVADTAATLVAVYCKAPEDAREKLRERIAQATAPNRVRVECAADAI